MAKTVELKPFFPNFDVARVDANAATSIKQKRKIIASHSHVSDGRKPTKTAKYSNLVSREPRPLPQTNYLCTTSTVK